MPNSPRGAPQGARIPQRILLGGSNIARLFCVGVPKTGEAKFSMTPGMLVLACLSVGNVGQSHFNHSGVAVKLVLAFSSVWKIRQTHFKHYGGAVQFVQAGLRGG